MEETEILAKSIDDSMKGFAGTLEATVAQIPEAIRKALDGPIENLTAAQVREQEAKTALAKAAGDKAAELEQLGGIMEMEVWDIPVGKALIGGFIAVVGSELVDGFLAKQSITVRGVAKLVGAGVAIKWGGRMLGKHGAAAVAILLAYDGLRDILPIDQYAHRLASGVSGVVTQRGLGGNTESAVDVPDKGNGHRESAPGDYYAEAFGGRR